MFFFLGSLEGFGLLTFYCVAFIGEFVVFFT